MLFDWCIISRFGYLIGALFTNEPLIGAFLYDKVPYANFIKLDIGMPARRPPDKVLRNVEELDRELGLGAELRRHGIDRFRFTCLFFVCGKEKRNIYRKPFVMYVQGGTQEDTPKTGLGRNRDLLVEGMVGL